MYTLITIESCDFAQINRTLSSDVSNLRPGDSATFTCSVTCSNILGWDSPEYIGTGGNYLEVLNSSNVPIHKWRVTASLIDYIQINDTCANIVAQVNFTVLENIQTAQISCININKKCNDTIKIRVSQDRKFKLEPTIFMVVYNIYDYKTLIEIHISIIGYCIVGMFGEH